MSEAGNRLGVLGGAFDPPHIAHLILAERAREQLQLDRVLFVPSYDPPKNHKSISTPFAQRCEMLAEALAGVEYFGVSCIEEQIEPPTYSVRMLEALKQELPADQLFFLMGADSLEQLHTWYHPEQLKQLATIGVARRPGYSDREIEGVVPVKMPLIEISASDLRQKAQKGMSLRFLVPDSVIDYIAAHGLYT